MTAGGSAPGWVYAEKRSYCVGGMPEVARAKALTRAQIRAAWRLASLYPTLFARLTADEMRAEGYDS